MSTFTLIGGPPGVGKTTMAPLLADKLQPCAWIDADDLWRIHPFEVTAQTKRIVESNLIHNVRQFLEGGYQHVFAIWVLHRRDLIERLVEAVQPLSTSTLVIHLTAPADVLRHRVEQEPQRGRAMERALERLGEVDALPYPKIQTGRLMPAQIAELVCQHITTAKHQS